MVENAVEIFNIKILNQDNHDNRNGVLWAIATIHSSCLFVAFPNGRYNMSTVSRGNH